MHELFDVCACIIQYGGMILCHTTLNNILILQLYSMF
jgi:hypothetical protein